MEASDRFARQIIRVLYQRPLQNSRLGKYSVGFFKGECTSYTSDEARDDAAKSRSYRSNINDGYLILARRDCGTFGLKLKARSNHRAKHYKRHTFDFAQKIKTA